MILFIKTLLLVQRPFLFFYQVLPSNIPMYYVLGTLLVSLLHDVVLWAMIDPVLKPKNPQNPWNIFFRDILERKAEKKGLDE